MERSRAEYVVWTFQKGLIVNSVPNHSDLPKSDRDDLIVYYCLCGEFVLVCNKAIEHLPERPLDKSRILRCLDGESADGQRLKAPMFKISASQGQGQMLKQ